MQRTRYCGEFRAADIGRQAVAMGWTSTRRDMGGIIFLDLRDREGTLQVVCDRARLGDADFSVAERLHAESVVLVRGEICLRGAETVNPLLPTGTVELRAESLELLSDAKPLPFPIDNDAHVREETRLRYRYLDLRRPVMFDRLRFRAKVVSAARRYLEEHGFLEVETPILTKSTPEGARDYLVPSRVHPGEFYALPQSPQQFKQLLMVGGVDKYYQVARCFRDEDLRADRQPEFTQVDMELSFVEQEDILHHLEDMFSALLRETAGIETGVFPRIPWQTAMDVYGSDKPDLRFGLPIVELTDLAASCSFEVFRRVTEAGGVVRGIRVPGGDRLTHTEIDALTAKARSLGARGMAWISVRPDGSVQSILTKYFQSGELDAILRRAEVQPGDFLLFCADKLSTVRRTLGGLRLTLADLLSLRTKEHAILFVTDFPEFEYSEEEKRWVATHHPFTMPYPEDLPYLKSDPARVRAQAFDVVLDGVELGSGSVRIHRSDVQETMFEALGFTPEEVQRRFGYFVDAFQYGTPPHGGFAFGLDRLVMLLAGADSIREITAFPKLKDASCPMTHAPDAVDAEQLEALGLRFGQAPGEHAAAHRAAPEIDVAKVARLAKLSIPETEREAVAKDMAAIVGFVDRLGSLPLDGVEPTLHPLPIENVLRPDTIQPSFARDALLQNAPERRNGCFVVPRVVE